MLAAGKIPVAGRPFVIAVILPVEAKLDVNLAVGYEPAFGRYFHVNGGQQPVSFRWLNACFCGPSYPLAACSFLQGASEFLPRQGSLLLHQGR